MVEEKWYIYSKEDRKFKPVNFSEVPDNSGSIILKYTKCSGHYNLDLISPLGDPITLDGGGLGNKRDNKRFEEKIQYLLNLSHNLCS